jgi:hypothetical protein
MNKIMIPIQIDTNNIDIIEEAMVQLVMCRAIEQDDAYRIYEQGKNLKEMLMLVI